MWRRTNVDVRLVALESSGIVSHVGTSARAPSGLNGVGGAIATESSTAGTQEGTGKRRHDAVQRVDWTRRRRTKCGESFVTISRKLNFFCLLCLLRICVGPFVLSSNCRPTIAKHADSAQSSFPFAFGPSCRIPCLRRTRSPPVDCLVHLGRASCPHPSACSLPRL